MNAPIGSVQITVLSTKPFHDIRVRNYEPDLRDCRLPLAELLDPAGIAHHTAEVTGIDSIWPRRFMKFIRTFCRSSGEDRWSSGKRTRILYSSSPTRYFDASTPLMAARIVEATWPVLR